MRRAITYKFSGSEPKFLILPPAATPLCTMGHLRNRDFLVLQSYVEGFPVVMGVHGFINISRRVLNGFNVFNAVD